MMLHHSGRKSQLKLTESLGIHMPRKTQQMSHQKAEAESKIQETSHPF